MTLDTREWLETNGTGAFAMGTVAGLATRRYHGLLVASLRPPTERIVTLARLDETADGVELAAVQYPGLLVEPGRPASFRHEPTPTWTFDLGAGRTLEKQLALVPGQQAVAIRYRASEPVRLRLAPFLALRDYHALGRSRSIDTTTASAGDDAARVVTMRPDPALPALRLWYSGEPFVADGVWYHRAQYAEEQARGLDFEEDLCRPGTFVVDVAPEAWVVATLDSDGWDQTRVERVFRARTSVGASRARSARAVPGAERAAHSPDLVARLRAAAEQFLVRRADGSLTVIAGYPWFTDWGRDTMIALPGLLLATARLDDARDVLRGFLAHIDRGLLPNLFPDRGTAPEYNTVDATLWLFQAVRAYLEAGGDRDFVRAEVYPAAREIIRWHLRGTHHGIHVDAADGLLVGGGPGTNLTWMDARVDGRVVTPRHGKAVEVNALWYNALREAAAWGREAGDRAHADRYDELADRVRAAFLPTFWNPQRGCLYDVVRPDGPDDAIRPNQIFAASLPHPLLPQEQARAVLDVVERNLLTPVGLRTLAPGERGYIPRYGGGPGERDRAYHQGTVWPWLLGPYVRGLLRVLGRTPDTVDRARAALAGLAEHLEEGCVGSISEVFDADAPHRPGGAPAQAWSVAEVLWLLTREIPIAAVADVERVRSAGLASS